VFLNLSFFASCLCYMSLLHVFASYLISITDTALPKSGGSAAAAGSLVRQLGGTLIGYVFLLELDFLQGRAKLDAPVHTLLSSQEKALST
jgi:hypothetical protein